VEAAQRLGARAYVLKRNLLTDLLPALRLALDQRARGGQSSSARTGGGSQAPLNTSARGQ
jgi:DNA-binding NarL/FixJ family response regulator